MKNKEDSPPDSVNKHELRFMQMAERVDKR